MRKATLFVREHPCLSGDAIFSGEPMEGMKSDAFMFIELRRLLAQQGIALATQDIHAPEDSDFVLCVDNAVPLQQHTKRPGQPWYLLLSEPATYQPLNYLPENQKIFDRIFTYDYTKVDNERVFLYRFAIDFESYPPFESVSEAEFARRRLCCLVAASFGVSKPVAGSGSLLHERYKVLKWFSDNHPDEFDFFSRGVESRELESVRGARVLRKVLPGFLFTALGKWRKRVFDRVYRGPIPPDDKIIRLRDYRFAIAYENTGNVPGYVTEKIFDCFAAAVVPVYWGAPNVAEVIPPACFIDRRAFASDEALYQHLRSMDYATYARHVAAIADYLGGSGPSQLTSAANSQAIAGWVLRDLQHN